MKTKIALLIFSVVLTFSSCKKCYTCKYETSVETYYTYDNQPGETFSNQSSQSTAEQDACEMSKSDVKQLEAGTVTRVVTPVTTVKDLHTVTTVKCDCIPIK